MRRRDWIAAFAGTAPVCAIQAQTGATGSNRPPGGVLLTVEERRRGYHENLSARAEALTRNQFPGIASRAQWEAVREGYRQRLRDDLGLPPPGGKTSLHPQVTAKLQRSGYSVENIAFQNSPGLYVIGNLYIPAHAPGAKLPTVVYVCGHSPSPLGAKVSYQHHGIWFARNGFIAFVLDTIEFGEISGIHHGTHNLEMWHWLSLGYNPSGVETWNAIRALDYLETRPEVDRTRIAITGRSGGGAISWFTAAVDERFHVASPVHGTWSIGPHVRNHTVRENCDCIYTWNAGLLDLPSIGALIAPRPLLIVNARRDVSFPPSGYEVVERQLRTVYQWYGAEEKLATFEDNTGHEDTPAYRKAAGLWISQWLTDARPEYTEEGIVREADPSVLRVLPTAPKDARNEGIDRSFIPAAAVPRITSLAQWKQRGAVLRNALSSRMLRGLASRDTPFATRKTRVQNWTERYAEGWNVQFDTEPALTVSGQLFLPKSPARAQSALIYLKGADDLVYGIDYDDILSILPEHAVLVLRPRCVEYGMTNPEMAETKMSAALLGTTLETLQLHDVLRAVDFLIDGEKLPITSLSVYGRKAMGMVAIYAGAMDSRITRVVLDRPPESHWDGPAVMHALRHTDIPEVAALIAPREVVFLGRVPSAYGLVETVAKLHPGGKPVREAVSLGDAMRGAGSA